MLNSTVLLTLATLCGLLTGFAREWLLVANWGVSAQTDTFLVAMFLPEAIRMILSGGLLSAAALPLWKEIHQDRQNNWLAGQFRHWLLFGTVLAIFFSTLSSYLVQLIGPGLNQENLASAAIALRYLSWIIPCLFIHALFTVPFQAKDQFLLPGLGSFLFNLPAVIYLLWSKGNSQAVALSQCFILGSLLMITTLIPAHWKNGWRPWLACANYGGYEVWKKLWPLLISSGASHGLALLERFVASFLGEGVITLLNFARKLINIPLIALMSLNQVILGKMSGEESMVRLFILKNGLTICTLLTLPTAVVLIATAPELVHLFLPKNLSQTELPALLALFSGTIVFGCWNAMLARYFYAEGDTQTPLFCELGGSAFQAIALVILSMGFGIWGIAGAILSGLITTCLLFIRQIDQSIIVKLIRLTVYSAMACGVALLIFFIAPPIWTRLIIGVSYGTLLLGLFIILARKKLFKT